jgi:hypothetical protein
MTKAAQVGGNRVGVNFHHDTEPPQQFLLPFGGGTSRRAAALAGAGALSATAYTSWLHRLALQHISVDVCRDLWRHGFRALALELWRQRGGVE